MNDIEKANKVFRLRIGLMIAAKELLEEANNLKYTEIYLRERGR